MKVLSKRPIYRVEASIEDEGAYEALTELQRRYDVIRLEAYPQDWDREQPIIADVVDKMEEEDNG